MEPKLYKAKTGDSERVTKVKRFLEMALAAKKREKAVKAEKPDAEGKPEH